jgi:hypothetical protein
MCYKRTLGQSGVLEARLDDLNGVVLQVEVDLALSHTVLLLSPLHHRLLVVRVKAQHLKTKYI